MQTNKIIAATRVHVVCQTFGFLTMLLGNSFNFPGTSQMQSLKVRASQRQQKEYIKADKNIMEIINDGNEGKRNVVVIKYWHYWT